MFEKKVYFHYLFKEEEPHWKTASMYEHLIFVSRILTVYDMCGEMKGLIKNDILSDQVSDALIYLETVAREIHEKEEQQSVKEEKKPE